MKIIKKIVNGILEFFSALMFAIPFAFAFFLYPEPEDDNDKKILKEIFKNENN